jgi:hypothetical protein
MKEYVIEDGIVYISISQWGLFPVGDVIKFN